MIKPPPSLKYGNYTMGKIISLFDLQGILVKHTFQMLRFLVQAWLFHSLGYTPVKESAHENNSSWLVIEELLMLVPFPDIEKKEMKE